MTSLSDISDYLTIENVRQDKIEINIGSWGVEAIDIEMTGFLKYLGSLETLDQRQSYRAFQQDNRLNPVWRSAHLKILSTRRGRICREMAPLFGGRLKIRRIESSETTDRYILNLNLSINPTRFCVYQPTPRRTRNQRERTLSDTPTLFATQNQTSYQGEQTLDGKDNVILKRGAILNASSRHWENNIRRYISGITTYFENELDGYISGGFAFQRLEEAYTIKTVENYWDIPVFDAIHFVKSLESQFIALSNNASISIYHDGGIIYDGSAICLRAKFRTGESIKIYAKTGQKVRFEVEHKYSQNSSLSEDRRYTAQSLDEVVRFISSSSTVSFNLAAAFWSVIRRHCSMSQLGGSDALYFVKRLYSVVGDINLAGELLSILSLQGGIPTKKLSSKWRNALNDLTAAGLVERNPRPVSRYTTPPRFHRSLLALKPISHTQSP